jgi:hypothetical protein
VRAAGAQRACLEGFEESRMRAHWLVPAAFAAIVAAFAAHSVRGLSATAVQPPGEDKAAKTRMLEMGAKVLQANAPVSALDVHLVGFHPMKHAPEHQMEAHHYCRQVNEDFAQCVLFDGFEANANLNGIEYIISERLFNTLPEAEKKFWHPHNGEILSGQLVAPGIPGPAEKAFMQQKMNSYGKTWHFWNTGGPNHAADKLPFGEPKLAWSFNRDGEAAPGLVEQRDQRLRISSADKRKERAELRALARPQWGVDALKGAFNRPVRDIPGVTDAGAARPR